MTQESEIREKKTYTFRNEDGASRTIVVEHPVRAGYELRGGARPVETTADWQRFRLSIEPKQTASIAVEEAHPTQATFALTTLSSEQLTLFVNQRSIDSTMAAAFRLILEQKNVIAQLESQKNDHEEETQKIFDNQQRLRENIKALKGTPEEKPLLQRYTQQLNEEESRLEALQKQNNQLTAQIESAQAQLDAAIQKLSFDTKL
jgi:chromosome segregation ATPase